MGDHTIHTPKAKDEASSAGNTAAARRTGAQGGDDSASGCSSHAEKKAARRTEVFDGDDGVPGLSSHAGNKAARRTLAYRDEESYRHAAASGALPSAPADVQVKMRFQCPAPMSEVYLATQRSSRRPTLPSLSFLAEVSRGEICSSSTVYAS
jgi:hypothetical protein